MGFWLVALMGCALAAIVSRLPGGQRLSVQRVIRV